MAVQGADFSINFFSFHISCCIVPAVFIRILGGGRKVDPPSYNNSKRGYDGWQLVKGLAGPWKTYIITGDGSADGRPFLSFLWPAYPSSG